MIETSLGKARAVLYPHAGATKFALRRYEPTPDLAPWVLRHWVVEWDLTGQPPYMQETLSVPCANLVIEPGGSGVFGVVSGKLTNLLEGCGRVFGVKFRPGGLYPFLGVPLATLTDSGMSLEAAFGTHGPALESAILSQPDDQAMIQCAEAFLRSRLPKPDANVEIINQIVDRIVTDRTIARVDGLVVQFAMSKRTLQRLFARYVGVSPKWVIRRYRLHEVADRLANGQRVDWPQLAVEMGYFDQAHFIKDFKMIVGTTPAEYAKNLG